MWIWAFIWAGVDGEVQVGTESLDFEMAAARGAGGRWVTRPAIGVGVFVCVCVCVGGWEALSRPLGERGRVRERQGERESLEKSRHFLKLNVRGRGINLGGPAGEGTLPLCSSCCPYRRQEPRRGTADVAEDIGPLFPPPIPFVSAYYGI